MNVLFNYPVEKAPVDLVLNIAVNSLVSGPGAPLFGASALPPPRLIMPEFFAKSMPPTPLNSPVQTFKGAALSSPAMAAASASASSSSSGYGGWSAGVGYGAGEKEGDNFSLRTLHRNFTRRPSHKKHPEAFINEEIASLSNRIVSLETNNIHQSTRIERVLVLLQSNPEFKKNQQGNEILAELEDIKACLINPPK